MGYLLISMGSRQLGLPTTIIKDTALESALVVGDRASSAQLLSTSKINDTQTR